MNEFLCALWVSVVKVFSRSTEYGQAGQIPDLCHLPSRQKFAILDEKPVTNFIPLPVEWANHCRLR